MRVRTAVIASVVVLAVAAVAFTRARRDGAAPGPTAAVQRGTVEAIVVASGTIEPEDLVDVRSKVSGIVERFHVSAGDRVRAGQVVAEIDRQTLEAAVREARAVLREAEVTRDQLGREAARKSALFKGGIESQEEIDRIRSEHAASEARRERARATLERLEQELAWATISAPIDGVVLQRDLNLGAAIASVAAVTGGTVLMTIADTSQMHLLGVVDENDIARVKVGLCLRGEIPFLSHRANANETTAVTDGGEPKPSSRQLRKQSGDV